MWTFPSFDVKLFAYYAPVVDELDMINLTVAGASEQRSVSAREKENCYETHQF